LGQLAQRDLCRAGSSRNDALDPDDPAVPHEGDSDRLERGLRRCCPHGLCDSGTGRRRGLEVDGEEACEGEHEDDEQDAHRAVPVRRFIENACKAALPLSSRP
jgi:hypothetical protein